MTLVLSHKDVCRLASMEMAIEAMESAYGLISDGPSGEPVRYDIDLAKGWLRLMVVEAEGLNVFGYKAMNLVPGVGVRYVIHLYDSASGDLQAIVDAKQITALRTAACAALATDRMAVAEVRRTAIVGTGVEARAQLLAMHIVRPAATVAVYSRSPDNRRRFIEEMTGSVGCTFEDCGSIEQAVTGADLVVLATKSESTVLDAEHLGAGVHVNSVGAARLDQRELAPGVFAMADLVVCDSVNMVIREAGDAAIAVSMEAFDPLAALSLADLVRSGRSRGGANVTVFKSVGNALQDIALASRVTEAAREKGAGWTLGPFPEVK